MTRTTLGKRALSELPLVAMVGEVQRRIEQARAAADPSDPVMPRHIAALSNFLDYLGDYGPAVDDPRAHAIWVLAGATGDTETFKPSPRQSELLYSLGTSLNASPSPDTTLSEFVAVGIEDFVEGVQGRIAQTERRNEELADELETVRREAAKAGTLRAELDEARDVIKGQADDLQKQEDTITYLRGVKGTDPSGDSPEGPSTQVEDGADGSEQKAVGGSNRKNIERGIYETPAGKLQIGWTTEEGRQRWLTLPEDASIEEARSFREALQGTDREPAEVVPV